MIDTNIRGQYRLTSTDIRDTRKTTDKDRQSFPLDRKENLRLLSPVSPHAVDWGPVLRSGERAPRSHLGGSNSFRNSRVGYNPAAQLHAPRS